MKQIFKLTKQLTMTMSKIFLTLCLIAGAAFGLCARGKVYHAGIFDKIDVMGNVNVVYKNVPDSAGMACYYSDTDYSDALELTNSKGKLTVKEVEGHGFGAIPTLYVYADYVSQLVNEGDGSLDAEFSSATPTLSVVLVGNGRVVCSGINATEVSAAIRTGHGTIALRGNCNTANFKLTGTGVIQADGLAAETVKCTVLGTGSIGCAPGKTLDVRGIGTTKVYYSGSPSIKKVGGATLIPINVTE